MAAFGFAPDILVVILDCRVASFSSSADGVLDTADLRNGLMVLAYNRAGDSVFAGQRYRVTPTGLEWEPPEDIDTSGTDELEGDMHEVIRKGMTSTTLAQEGGAVLIQAAQAGGISAEKSRQMQDHLTGIKLIGDPDNPYAEVYLVHDGERKADA